MSAILQPPLAAVSAVLPDVVEPVFDTLARAEAWARDGRLEDALALCRALMPRLVREGDPVALGTCEHIVALAQIFATRLRESMLAGYRAIEHLDGTQAFARLLQVLPLQASALARLGAASEALEMLDRATPLLPRIQDSPRASAVFWINASAVYETLDLLPQSNAASRRANALVTSADDAALRAVCLGNVLMGEIQERLVDQPADPARLRAAVQALEACLQQFIADGRHHFVPEGVRTLADGLLLLGEHVSARGWLERGIASTQVTGAASAQGLLRLRLARLDRREGRLDDAADQLARASAVMSEGPMQEGQATVHLETSELHEALGDWRAALESYKRHVAIRAALLAAQADARAQAAAIRLELERNRLEAELLRTRNAELQRSMSELADEAGVFRRQAMEDPLTGLSNRRGLQQRIGQETDRPLTLFMMDIDHFKRINDGWSHAVGDLVLKAFAALLRDQSRPHDVVSRIGGEEFVVALGGVVTVRRAMLVAERLRAAVAHHDWSAIGAGLVVTTSIGVATRGAGESLDAALARADVALYECKRMGRNQVRCAS